MIKPKLDFRRRQLALALMHEAYADNPVYLIWADGQEITKRESPAYHRSMAALYRRRAEQGAHVVNAPMRRAA